MGEVRAARLLRRPARLIVHHLNVLLLFFEGSVLPVDFLREVPRANRRGDDREANPLDEVEGPERSQEVNHHQVRGDVVGLELFDRRHVARQSGGRITDPAEVRCADLARGDEEQHDDCPVRCDDEDEADGPEGKEDEGGKGLQSFRRFAKDCDRHLDLLVQRDADDDEDEPRPGEDERGDLGEIREKRREM